MRNRHAKPKLLLIVSAMVLVLLMEILAKQGECDMQTNTAQTAIQLPQPVDKNALPLYEALAERRSVRRFTDTCPKLQAVSNLLWAAQGITNKRGFRTAPSAGARYPLEMYLIVKDAPELPQGLYHYLPRGHRLERRKTGDLREELCRAALSQRAVREAPLSIVIAGIPERTTTKYGQRGIRYVFLEAGHAAQNLLLEAVSLGLGAVPVGAFDDAAVSRLLGLATSARPLYIIPVGHPVD